MTRLDSVRAADTTGEPRGLSPRMPGRRREDRRNNISRIVAFRSAKAAVFRGAKGDTCFHTGPKPGGSLRIVAAAGWLLIAAGASTLPAADPQLGRLTPCGAQRGTEVEVVLQGARLADAREVLLYYPGIRVAALSPVEKNPNAVKAKLAIAPDCRQGLHALRVRTATGVSNLKTFSVGALKQISETEPNNEFESPQKIDLDTTVAGVVQNEDVDYFLVEAKKGERISVEIEGLRLGETFFDPYVAILDQGRFVLAGSDDTPLVRQDAACSAIAPKDGAYAIQVRESAFGGSGQCRYRLHVGRFPRPLAVFPPGGRFGQTLEVRWLGDPAGPWTEKITLPAAPQPMFGLTAHDGRGVAPSPNAVRVIDLASRDEGFKAPITLRMLYSPSGVSSPTTVVIPEGKSDGVVPLTANSGAAVRKWKIAVTGDATVGDGQVTVSSQLADLDVAEPFFKFTFPTVTAEQGQQAVLAVKVEKNRDFEGAAKVELLGMPNEVTTEPQQITKESAEVRFTLKTTAKSPPGQHKGLICRAVVVSQGEPITHTLGTGELRIFKPLPKKPAAQAKPQPKPSAKPQPKPAQKPLSRLEQLRLEREKAKQQGQPAPKP